MGRNRGPGRIWRMSVNRRFRLPGFEPWTCHTSRKSPVTSYGTVAGLVLSLSGLSGWNRSATAGCREYAVKFHWSSPPSSSASRSASSIGFAVEFLPAVDTFGIGYRGRRVDRADAEMAVAYVAGRGRRVRAWTVSPDDRAGDAHLEFCRTATTYRNTCGFG